MTFTALQSAKKYVPKWDPLQNVTIIRKGSKIVIWYSIKKKYTISSLPKHLPNSSPKISQKDPKTEYFSLQRMFCGNLILLGSGTRINSNGVQTFLQNWGPKLVPKLGPTCIQNKIQQLGSQFAGISAESRSFVDVFGICVVCFLILFEHFWHPFWILF